MSRTTLILAGALALLSSPLAAQAHAVHRHPRGASIVLLGTLADPMCAFAQQLADSAQARCAGQHAHRRLEPVLLSDESVLYLLAFRPGASGRSASVQAMIGKRVQVEGTVYPAGNAYLVVVDSVRTSTP
ncbi:MAG TPA: hypothetical protein VMF70_01035 [Gemmatimonadales bacterium]|nr:hypothetical protein [Gemmatimonadales bacterium]HUK73332.1 hypothetical protein [Streptosporangiaceae bacterium]